MAGDSCGDRLNMNRGKSKLKKDTKREGKQGERESWKGNRVCQSDGAPGNSGN